MSFIKFFQEAITYATPDASAVEQAGDSSPRHLKYHRLIVLFGILLGSLGLLAGIAFVAYGLSTNDRHFVEKRTFVLLIPLMSAAVGTLNGAAWSLCFAPTAFLQGPLGGKWMRLIGTNNVLVARLVCLILASLITTAIVVIIWHDFLRR